MKRACLLAAVPLLFALAPNAGAAQTAPYTQGSVWSIGLVRVKGGPGMADVYYDNLRANWRRVMEEAKR